MERKEAIRSAYRLTGSSSFYDGMMTCSTLPGRLVCRLVWDMDKQMCSGYQEKALSGIPAQVNRVGSLLTVFFTEQSVTGYDQARSSDPERFRLWYNGLLQRGIYAAPSQFEAMFLSSAHTDEDIQRVIDAAREIF